MSLTGHLGRVPNISNKKIINKNHVSQTRDFSGSTHVDTTWVQDMSRIWQIKFGHLSGNPLSRKEEKKEDTSDGGRCVRSNRRMDLLSDADWENGPTDLVVFVVDGLRSCDSGQMLVRSR